MVKQASKTEATKTKASKKGGWIGSITQIAEYSVLLLLTAFLVFLVYGLPINNAFYKIVVIDGGSMSPTIEFGDLVILTKPPAKLQISDIAVMQVDSSVVTHRIIGIKDNGSYRTQGDANKYPDDFSKNKVKIVGIERFHIPWIGYAFLYRSQLIPMLKDRWNQSLGSS